MPDIGRTDQAGRWPAPVYASTLAVVVASLGLTGWLLSTQIDALTPNERLWLWHDLKTGLILPVATWAGTPLAIGGLVLFIGLVWAVPKDLARAKARRQGDRLRGPVLATGLAGDGVGWVQSQGKRVSTTRERESRHFLFLGDIGTGKSAAIFQLLTQIENRGELAVVYDPHREYTAKFYTPTRGDMILNPLDTRSPYWSPSDEIRQQAEALTVATSLFPDRPNENPFFVEGPRRLFAHLLTFHPSAQELAYWLSHEAEIDRRVVGTAYAALIDRNAPSQRSGILASLNMIADTLTLLPFQKDTTSQWSASRWADDRKGWLFITSTPQTRSRLVPLQSLWLDLLILRLMTNAPSTPVWFILDELASLQKLPQLQVAITENRKSRNPICIGIQGRSQLEELYGRHAAETMTSQPAHKLILRTSDPHAAAWASQLLGEVETERLHESRSSGAHRQHGYELHRQIEPLVMASEIEGLPDLQGFLKVGNEVVPMRLPYLSLPTRAAGLIERVLPIVAPPVAPVDAVAAPVMRGQALMRG